MKMMIQISQAKRGIEVGTFTGYSALVMAEGLPDDGKLIALDISEEWTSLGKKYWKEAGVDHKIDLILGDGCETLDGLIAEADNLESFDFAFIDADKPNYPKYYERLLKLLKPNGFIMVDNVLWGGSVVEKIDPNDHDTKALRLISEIAHEDERVDQVMVPLGDGLMVLRKR